MLGKSRSVTVQEERVVMRKHPEDDHHAECNPILLLNITPHACTETCVRKFDRTEKDHVMPSTTQCLRFQNDLRHPTNKFEIETKNFISKYEINCLNVTNTP